MKQQHHPIPEFIKRQVVDEYLTTDVTQRELLKRFKIRGNNIQRWIHKFAAERGQDLPQNNFSMRTKPTTPAEPTSDSAGLSAEEELERLRKENAALKSALDYEKLKSQALDTMIDLAEKSFNIPIRKKSGAKQSIR